MDDKSGLLIALIALMAFIYVIRLLNNFVAKRADDRRDNEVLDRQRPFLEPLANFISQLKANASFLSFFETTREYAAITDRSDTKSKISYLLTIDIAACHGALPISRANGDKRPSAYCAPFLPVLYFFAIDQGVEPYDINAQKLHSKEIISSPADIILNLVSYRKLLMKKDDGTFILANILANFDATLAAEYVQHLYNVTEVIAKSDGDFNIEEKVLLSKFNIADIKKVTDKQQPKAVKSSSNSLEKNITKLNNLTGLEDVKKEVTQLVNFIKIQKARETSGLKTAPISYHLVLTGNPGTGKTTVARIIAGIYKNMGILSKGQLVEADRADLIAEYEGQTAVKVNKVVDSALDGVLFIDEAYSLLQSTSDSYGKEAIATLIKRMEDDRDRLVVIVAGYTDEMKNFIDGNPGFKSRFNRFINFDDYTPESLLSIYQYMCTEQDYTLTDDAKARLTEAFTAAYNNRDRSFGNARFVRNVFEKSMELQATRLSTDTSLDKTELTTITGEDIPAYR